MKAVVTRVREASVAIGGACCGKIGKGFLVLLGVGPGDTEKEAERMADKICGLRVFEDEAGKMNLALGDVGGELLVVSQFTLYADCRRGNRPSFTGAAEPALANRLYERFCELAERDVAHVGRGVFAAEMQVELVNDGPITIWLDTEELGRSRRS